LGISNQGSDPRNNSLDKKIKPVEPQQRQGSKDILGQKRQSAVVHNPSDMIMNPVE
jgi:hypothetical protein